MGIVVRGHSVFSRGLHSVGDCKRSKKLLVVNFQESCDGKADNN